jgi:hypothetical protein
MKLPNGERADVGNKLETYSLNAMHREGRHKARVFASALGITLANAGVLHRAVRKAAAESGDAEERGDNGFGRVFVLKFPLETEMGVAEILTAWIIRRSEDFPRLTTCHIL